MPSLLNSDILPDQASRRRPHPKMSPLDTMKSRLHTVRFETALVINSILMALGITLAGLFYVRNGEAEAKRAAQDQLAAIADLKVRQIVGWRDERLKDASFFSRAKFVAQDVKTFLDNPTSRIARSDVNDWLQLLKGGPRYEQVILLNKAFKPLVSTPDGITNLSPAMISLLAEAEKTNRIYMSDLHREPGTDDIHFEIILPIYEPGSAQTNAPVIAYIILQLNPREFLYPLVRTWPTASVTAETLLFRRDGDHVLYLSDLRNRPGTALTFRLPLTRTNLPAAATVRGFTGVMEGEDYRGVPVVAAGRPVPGSSWFMVAKMDRTEIYASLRQQSWMAGIIFATLLVSSILLTGLLWRNRAAAELKKVNLELEKRVEERTADLHSKNQELESFTSTVSHDLKTPLRTITGYAALLDETYGGKLDDQGNKALNSIKVSAARMNQLIEDLLKYSRLEWEGGQLVETDLVALVKEVLSDHESEIRRLKTTVKVKVDPGSAMADVSVLCQALSNLIGNAIKFSGKSPSPLVEILGSDRGRVYLLEVRDNGIGFDMRNQEQIFQIFKRLHSPGDYPGTGVGLAIVKKSVQRLGGRVWAESEPGRGARFFIELPRDQKTTAA